MSIQSSSHIKNLPGVTKAGRTLKRRRTQGKGRAGQGDAAWETLCDTV